MVAMRYSTISLVFAALVLALSVCGVEAGPPLDQPQTSPAERFTVYFFDQQRSAAAAEMWHVLDGADPEFLALAQIVRVREDDLGAQDLKRQYGVLATPFTLVVAPTGTVTGGHAGVVDLDEIRRGFVSRTIQEIIQAAQQRKVVFVVVPGTNQETSARARVAAGEVEAALSRTVTVVEMDSNAPEDRTFLANLGVQRFGPEVSVFVLSSSGLVDRLEGNITSTQLFSSFQGVLATNSGCGGANEGGLKASCKEQSH